MNRLILTLAALSTGVVLVCGGLRPGHDLPVAAADEPAPKLGEERIPPGEDEDIKKLVALQLGIMKNTDPTKRGQHPKQHGCVDAEFTVCADIPAEYRYGLFKEARSYKAKVRFSNGGKKDDTQDDLHGMAIKVREVKGTRAVPEDGREEQDFLLIDTANFFVPDVKTMVALMQAQVASATDPDALKKFTANFPITAKLLSEAPNPPPPSPLTVRYYSTVPYKLGDRAVKYSAEPGTENGPGYVRPDGADYLRAVMVDRLSKNKPAATFHFFIIPQTDPAKMPIEDPTAPWKSKPVLVAKIKIDAQVFDTPERMKDCEESSFDPWHAIVEHQPLGGINRARRAVYVASFKLRSESFPRP